ncbi:uncharacterized protein (TIGR03084 family) [Aeromicrobium panaciterrae]|uniref:Uncharacterized protein (TIGR03084 family) n=1 Tax=Aeromicrobium panaciterrae TaxID=363861 RepID=A0ABU1UKC6_9ACTN|nr:TIGR03084 family metal-binding protein [Aeromicrobium panaciterrae]MDR7085629.1 uncharacterized protein (TIGR03084 family) [Aeromicrobium panaciterrae]
MTILDQVLTDLEAESAQLDSWVSVLDAAGWETITTPEGWTVTHQIGHLHWTDLASHMAITDEAAFAENLKEAAKNPTGFVDLGAEEMALTPPAELLTLWREGRTALQAALRGVPDGERIPWYGPPMSPVSMVTARLMETWAHSHDVAEALGIEVPKTSRAKHVAHIGVRARGFAYMMRGEEIPEGEVRVELTGPDGDLWTWGPEDAPERVTGNGYDFALLVSRRRHRDDVDVRAIGENAEHWLTIAQAFAGLPGNDPQRLADR